MRTIKLDVYYLLPNEEPHPMNKCVIGLSAGGLTDVVDRPVRVSLRRGWMNVANAYKCCDMYAVVIHR